MLHRPKFHFTTALVDTYIGQFCEMGIASERIHSEEFFPDPKDMAFYEVALSKKGCIFGDGQQKAFPQQANRSDSSRDVGNPAKRKYLIMDYLGNTDLLNVPKTAFLASSSIPGVKLGFPVYLCMPTICVGASSWLRRSV